jgi:hypothetical protein
MLHHFIPKKSMDLEEESHDGTMGDGYDNGYNNVMATTTATVATAIAAKAGVADAGRWPAARGDIIDALGLFFSTHYRRRARIMLSLFSCKSRDAKLQSPFRL